MRTTDFLASWILPVAFGVAALSGAQVALAQVPGICTAPDGEAWKEVPAFLMDPQDGQSVKGASSSTVPLPRRSSPSRIANAPSPGRDEAALLKWLKERDSKPIPQGATASEPSYGASPNSGSPNTGSPPWVGVPPREVHATPVSSRNPSYYSPHSIPSIARLQSAGDDDDLLAPTPTLNNPSQGGSNDLLGGDDLLQGGAGLGGSGDPLSNMGPDAAREKERVHSKPSGAGGANDLPPGVDPHWEIFVNDRYPSAIKCAKCHQQIYDEWRVSAHAYAAISPMFTRFEQKITELSRGTAGTFCMRCHAPVATQVDFPRDAPIFQGSATFREGITCIACHRVVERYGRVNGERRIETGSEYDPMVGTLGGDGVREVVANRDNYKVKIDPSDKRPLQPMHREAIQFEQLSDSSFCAGCHQVVVQPGIALEVVYQQYRQGPACKKGVSCQDCHMGAVPGKALGYTTVAAAVVNEKAVNAQRKHANHVFYGPSVPLAHPGLFPHNEKSLRWSPDAWLLFDHRQGWGTEVFERGLANGQFHMQFPEPWRNAQERRDARKVLDENQKLLDYKRQTAQQIIENGSKIDGPFFSGQPVAGKALNFSFVVSNLSEGHNMPSGSLGAQPQLWLNVALIGPTGERLWESGDLDSNGDLRDLHSLDVRAKRIPIDLQLTNFQTKFLITNAKGTEREMYLPVNVDIDPLPFFRPGTVPYSVLNHPPFIRMEAHSIPPLDSRTSKYRVPAELMKMPGTYRLSVRLRSRVEPPYFMLFCGGTPDMLNALNESILDIHPYSTEFVVH